MITPLKRLSLAIGQKSNRTSRFPPLPTTSKYSISPSISRSVHSLSTPFPLSSLPSPTSALLVHPFFSFATRYISKNFKVM